MLKVESLGGLKWLRIYAVHEGYGYGVQWVISVLAGIMQSLSDFVDKTGFLMSINQREIK